MASGTEPQPFSISCFRKIVYTVYSNESIPPNSRIYKWVDFNTQTGYEPIAVTLESSQTATIPKFNDSLDIDGNLHGGTIVVWNSSQENTYTTTVHAIVTYVKK